MDKYKPTHKNLYHIDSNAAVICNLTNAIPCNNPNLLEIMLWHNLQCLKTILIFLFTSTQKCTLMLEKQLLIFTISTTPCLMTLYHAHV